MPTLIDGQIWVRMQTLLAMLGHSHNSVWHFDGADRVDVTMLPITFYSFSDGLHVVDAERPEWVGAKVERIANTPAAEALRRVETVVTSETPMKVFWLGPVYLRMPQVLHTLGITDDAGPVPLTFRLRDGTRTTVTLDPVPVERRKKLHAPDIPETEPPLWLSRPDDHYWMQDLQDVDALYTQINQVVNETDVSGAGGPRVESLDAFNERLRAELRSTSPANLILDVRRNNGGNTFLYTELLRTLVAYDVQPKTHVFVLAGRNTASAAVNLATDLDRLTHATFVGEPTGGKPNTHGNESGIRLPYSGLTLGLSNAYWQHSHPGDERVFLYPDVAIGLSSTDYLDGRDPVMSAVRLMQDQR